MKRIVFEGTENQLENLKALLDYGSNDLPKERNDFQTNNLWSVKDVQREYPEVPEEEAMEVLETALEDEKVMETIWEAVIRIAEEAVEENGGKFKPHGFYQWSNGCGYEVQINETGEVARLRYPFEDYFKVTGWLEIEDVFDEETAMECALNGDEDDPEEGDFYRKVIDPKGYDIPLNLVMRINRP